MMNRLSPSSSSPYTSGGGLSGGAGGNYTGGAAANVSYIPAGWTGFK